MSANPPYELIDPIARAVSDLAREISAVGPLVRLVQVNGQRGRIVNFGFHSPASTLAMARVDLGLEPMSQDAIATNLAALAPRTGA